MQGRRAHDRTAIVGLLCAVCGILVLGTNARAERLPLTTYTTANGLAHNYVVRIVRDSRGLIWFCTREGLSRFDGHAFKTYTTADGLPHQSVHDLIETTNGEYWIATAGGLARLIPGRHEGAGEPLFSRHVPERDQDSRNVTRLLQDHNGTIWVGTIGGLFQLERAGDPVTFRFVDLRSPNVQTIESLLEDRQGSLWIGTSSGFLYRRWPDGRVEHYARAEGLPADRVTTLVSDDTGTIWAGTSQGLAQLVPHPVPGQRVVARVFTTRDGLGDDWISALHRSPNGTILVACGRAGLSLLRPSSNAAVIRTFTEENGIPGVIAVTLDGDDLWLGSATGVFGLSQSGMTVFAKADGLGTPVVGSIFTSRAGEICVFGNDHFARFDGTRFVSIPPNYGRRITQFPWEARHVALQDRGGDVWLATGQGLYRFPRVDRLEDLTHLRPRDVYGTRHRLTGDFIFLVYEDRRGDIWILSGHSTPWTLVRWHRATDTFQAFSERDGWRINTYVSDITESANGDLWIAAGALVRYRDGRFRFFTTADGLPSNDVNATYIDDRGRLWATTDTAGAVRIDHPDADRLDLRVYTVRDDLASNQVLNVVGDRFGQVYFVTGRGIDRLNPETNEIRHTRWPTASVPVLWHFAIRRAHSGSERISNCRGWFQPTRRTRRRRRSGSAASASAVWLDRSRNWVPPNSRRWV